MPVSTGEFIVDDLLDSCQVLRDQAARGEVAFSINHAFRWTNGKSKTIDLAIGIPFVPKEPPAGRRIRRLVGQGKSRKPEENFSQLLVACEEKAVMTEHVKSQPRVYSELTDSHTIVHNGDLNTIAAGVTMVNSASSFISPLRQRPDKPVEITYYDQPRVTQRMVDHLRKLPIRDDREGIGLDAYCTFVLHVDNPGHVALQKTPPAPREGDIDHYETFLGRISAFYTARFFDLKYTQPVDLPTFEQQLLALAHKFPGLLGQTGDLAVSQGLAGSDALRSILNQIEEQVNGPQPSS